MEGETASPVSQYLAFTLASELFAVEIHKAREVLKFTSLTKVPNTPDYMRGVINLRGNVLPVIDIRFKLGFGWTVPTVDTCVAIFEVELESGGVVIGALVDTVEEVMEIDAAHVAPPPNLGRWVNSGVIRGLGRREEQFVMILDLDKVFGPEVTALAPSGQAPIGIQAQG